jgi:glutathione S-transferase
MKLYDLELSGNCYKVRLFCAVAQIPIEIVPVDFMAGEHKKPAYLQINPLGELPALIDADVVLRDSQAILVYLAAKYGGEAWLPKEPMHMAKIVQWLSTSANEIARGPNDARLAEFFKFPIDKAAAQAKAAAILPVIDRHLAMRQWLELGRPTIADFAVFPYVALAPQGSISLDPFPNILSWIARIKGLPHFLPMPGIPA